MYGLIKLLSKSKNKTKKTMEEQSNNKIGNHKLPKDESNLSNIMTDCYNAAQPRTSSIR